MNRIEEIKIEDVIIKRGRGRPLKIKEIKEEIKDDTIKKKVKGRPPKGADRITSWKMKDKDGNIDKDYYNNYYHTHTKLKRIKERLDAGLPLQKRGRKKGVIYDPIEINLMLEKEKLKLISH
jgi:hypothetical protein